MSALHGIISRLTTAQPAVVSRGEVQPGGASNVTPLDVCRGYPASWNDPRFLA